MKTSTPPTQEHVLEQAGIIIERYLTHHGKRAYTYRPFIKGGIQRRADYRYHANLAALLPEAALGTFSYLWTTWESESESTLRFALIPYAPVRIFVNGTLCARSDIFNERRRSKVIFDFPMQAGVNDIVLECENTSGGFGCEFGTWVGKLDYYFLTPDREMEGVWYADPVPEPLGRINRETLGSLTWYNEIFLGRGGIFDLEEIYPDATDEMMAVVVTSVTLPEERRFINESSVPLFIDGEPVMSRGNMSAGTHLLVAHARISRSVRIALRDAQSEEKLELVNPILGSESPYRILVAGPFDAVPPDFPIQFTEPFETADALSFWRLEGRDTYLRIYNDNERFGHWNYPLGVTLYGLVEMERLYASIDPDLAQRIHALLLAHMQQSIDTYAYALWDKETFGGATAVHHLMTSLDSLDDCGSFAATMLEVARDHALAGYESLMEVVGRYISEVQPRLGDGTFFRTGLMHEFQENTLWVDDLYMSVPFLCRYAALTENGSYLADAIRQFDGFFALLYMEETQLMSHVYDFERDIATGIPWGRGNGWALFSLSELLLVLDEQHPDRRRMLEYYRRLSAGFLRVQDEQGMFHQVLDMPSSYPESSCTAMFAAAISRGIRCGWFVECEAYEEAVSRAVAALLTRAIDSEGRVLGVCRGSEFSCSRRYYAEDLLPRIDDTHGIGIILLALREYLRLR